MSEKIQQYRPFLRKDKIGEYTFMENCDEDGFYDSDDINPLLADRLALRKAIAIYCREELGHIEFDDDDAAVKYFINVNGDRL